MTPRHKLHNRGYKCSLATSLPAPVFKIPGAAGFCHNRWFTVFIKISDWRAYCDLADFIILQLELDLALAVLIHELGVGVDPILQLMVLFQDLLIQNIVLLLDPLNRELQGQRHEGVSACRGLGLGPGLVQGHEVEVFG